MPSQSQEPTPPTKSSLEPFVMGICKKRFQFFALLPYPSLLSTFTSVFSSTADFFPSNLHFCLQNHNLHFKMNEELCQVQTLAPTSTATQLFNSLSQSSSSLEMS
ncbi:hypothetical protein VNO78_17026 [Psophocarpus tetragonolobus]|uniref:Uncharacterized protein n=1 Tax=Psophocarpus tetragonolobus TaxID=3891 RepID=A0AAN9XL05_PSOTE